MRDLVAFGDVVQGAAESSTVMGGVHLHEPKQCRAQPPVLTSTLFDPVARDREICITIAGLPSIAGDRDITRNLGALEKWKQDTIMM
jgi:hypothetical protein